MGNDPHRDALAAALARVDALEQENRALRDRSPTAPRTPVPAAPQADAMPEGDGAPSGESERLIDDTLRQLSARLDASEPAPTATSPARERRRPQCASCGGRRTVESDMKPTPLSVPHRVLGSRRLEVTRVVVCADCGHVALALSPKDLAWLDDNYLSTILADEDR